MGIDLKLTVDGVEKFNQALAFVDSKISDWRPVWDQEVEPWFYKIEEAQFASQGSRANAWKPLSDSYANWKAKHHPGKPILEVTGALRRSLTGRGAGGIRTLTATELILGSSIDYALVHQRGSDKGKRKIPARPPIDFTERDEKNLVKIFLQAMADIGAKGGFEVPYRDIFDNSSQGVPF